MAFVVLALLMCRAMTNRSVIPRSLLTVALVAAACSSSIDSGFVPSNIDWLQRQAGEVSYTYTSADAGLVTTITPVVASEAAKMTAFLGLPFGRPFGLTVSPDWATFADRFRMRYQVAPQCWVIATASGAGIELLSPRAWQCGHDGTSGEHLRTVLAHELVHVLHAQQTDSGYSLGQRWIAEGLGVYASGQLDADYAGDAQRRFNEGFVPTSLERLPDESGGYGLSGDLIRYIDRGWGRAMLRSLMRAETTAAAVAMLNETEASLLARWRATHRP
jgi:hypothetical protein